MLAGVSEPSLRRFTCRSQKRSTPARPSVAVSGVESTQAHARWASTARTLPSQDGSTVVAVQRGGKTSRDAGSVKPWLE